MIFLLKLREKKTINQVSLFDCFVFKNKLSPESLFRKAQGKQISKSVEPKLLGSSSFLKLFVIQKLCPKRVFKKDIIIHYSSQKNLHNSMITPTQETKNFHFSSKQILIKNILMPQLPSAHKEAFQTGRKMIIFLLRPTKNKFYFFFLFLRNENRRQISEVIFLQPTTS